MDHLAEESIERYLLEPDRFSDAELYVMYTHLKECPRCRSIRDFLEDFYARLEEASSREAGGAVPASPEKTNFAHPVILRPMKDVPEFRLGPEARITVLAAESVVANTHRFTTMAALVSEREKVVMRIIHDRLENRYRMYLIAEDTERVKHTKVSIPALGIDLVTDEHGIAEFVLAPSREEPEWNTLQAVLAS